MQKLINPLIEYQYTIDTDKIRALREQMERYERRVISKIEKTRFVVQKNLEDFFPERVQKDKLPTLLNDMIRECVKLSLYGEFLYTHPEIYRKYPNLKHWSEYLITAARSYQKIFEISKKYFNDRENYLLLLISAAEFNNSMQHAAAATIAREAIEFLKIYAEKESSVEKVYFSLHKILLRFFGGYFIEKDENGNIIKVLKKEIETLYKQIYDIISNEENLTYIRIIEYGCMLYILKSILLFIDFVFTGKTHILNKSKTMASKSVEMANVFKRADLIFFSKKIKLSIDIYGQLSIWNLRRFIKVENKYQNSLLNEYIQRKIDEGVYFFYPSQLAAIEKGILDRKYKKSIVSMPTGSGKTLLSELIIFSEILANSKDKGLSLYMVPSRALAREKFKDFSKIFENLENIELKVCQITGEVILDAETAIKEYDIVILTPEKFDMIMRENFYDREISTLVIDEFHNIRTGYRGTKIEFNILRFKEKYHNVRQILISAIVSSENFKEMEKWFGSDISVYITWRPTFSRIGIYDLYNKDNYIIFNDGISVPFDRRFTRRKDAKLNMSVELALKFGEDGPCMVFCRTKQDVKNISKKFIYMADEKKITSLIDIEKNENYSKKLYRLIGDEDIYKLYKRGIGIHRGDLPHRIRKLVEDGIKENALRFVLATTTLAEGVNLPLKTIIVPEPKVGKEDMELSPFFNLLGRAGRPYKEHEGQLIFITSKNYSKKDIEKKFFYASSKDIEKITTPIWHIVELEEKIAKSNNIKDIKRYELEKEIHENVLETMLLALLHEYPEMITNFSDNFNLIEKLVIALAKDIDKEYMKKKINEIFKRAEKRMIKFGVIKRQNGYISETDFGKIVYKTGFSPESCKKLFDNMGYIIQLLDKSTKLTRYSIMREFNILKSIFKMMEIPIETRAYFFDNGLPPQYVNILYSWMKGIYIDKIADNYFNGIKSEAMVKVQGLLSGYSAWFLYAIYVLIKYLRPKAKYLSSLEILPSFAWYGTNDPLAIKILEKDISRQLLRDDVLKFVRNFNKNVVIKILKNPDTIHWKNLSNNFKTKLFNLKLKTEEKEFIDTLYNVLNE